MKPKHDPDVPIDLGPASRETKGGPWGVDDFMGTYMLPDASLTDD